MEHPEGFDKSVLIGGGARSWFRKQERKYCRTQTNHKNEHKDQFKPAQFQQEQTKSLSKEESNKLKRQNEKKPVQTHQRITSKDADTLLIINEFG